jgi:hypothetical protein
MTEIQKTSFETLQFGKTQFLLQLSGVAYGRFLVFNLGHVLIFVLDIHPALFGLMLRILTCSNFML